VNLSHSELAEVLGFSRQYVGKLVQKGMPMTSVKAAKEWQAAHCPNAGNRSGNQGATKQATREATKPLSFSRRRLWWTLTVRH